MQLKQKSWKDGRREKWIFKKKFEKAFDPLLSDFCLIKKEITLPPSFPENSSVLVALGLPNHRRRNDDDATMMSTLMILDYEKVDFSSILWWWCNHDDRRRDPWLWEKSGWGISHSHPYLAKLPRLPGLLMGVKSVPQKTPTQPFVRSWNSLLLLQSAQKVSQKVP